MYKQGIFTIIANDAIAPNIYRMVLKGDTSQITAPGQFVNIEIEGRYLRRPISVCDYSAEDFTIIYKVVGGGTADMSRMEVGKNLDILMGLGNGFSTKNYAQRPLLVGGGVGVPPLYNLCKVLLSQGKRPTVILGFNTASEVFMYDEFVALGVDVIITTVDASRGVRGYVTAALPDLEFDFLYTCGPIPMLKALWDATPTVRGEYSFEERMGCGFGACVGCTCKTKYGYKRICKDGPVLDREEIIW
ncbi:MAG: dihydroorotate dehydrogenase electron transfer subunit [Rikenellaceae bacterium]